MLLCAMAVESKMIDRRKTLPQQQLKDTLPEWSKGVDSSSTSASCVGSNPTGVIINFSDFQLDAMCQRPDNLAQVSASTGRGSIRTHTQTQTCDHMQSLLQHRGPLGLMDKASDF